MRRSAKRSASCFHHVAVIAFTNQTVTFLNDHNDHTTVAKSFYNFFFGRSQTVRKTGVCHHSTIIPPIGKLLRIGSLGLTDG